MTPVRTRRPGDVEMARVHPLDHMILVGESGVSIGKEVRNESVLTPDESTASPLDKVVLADVPERPQWTLGAPFAQAKGQIEKPLKEPTSGVIQVDSGATTSERGLQRFWASLNRWSRRRQ